jgi:hypothetical protein
MVNSTPAFSSISTPTSYPESNRRYRQGTHPNLRVPREPSSKWIKNGECLCIDQSS